MGDSWGRWEGETLVIETTNINPAQSLVGSGASFSASPQATITERLTRVGPNTINYEFTVDDPGTFVRSFQWRGARSSASTRSCTSTRATRATTPWKAS